MEKLDYITQYRNKTKVCRKCRNNLTNSNWWKSRKTAGDYICDVCYKKHHKEYYSKNKKRILKVQKEYYDKHKDIWNNARLKYDYGISLDDYNEMLKQQNGVCAICGGEEAGGNQYGKVKMHVDHNHLTKKVRGLLCCKCNMALGGLDVDVKHTELLYKAIKYLEDNSCA